MLPKFSPEAEKQLAELLPKYPTRMAACLPALWIAQEQFGWISDDVIKLVAERLELPLSHVYGVVSFYTMYHRKPRGTYHVQVCTNVACMLRDAYEVLRRFEAALGIHCGQTTEDGMFTLSEVECLAACGGAPCVQVNDDYHEPVRPEDVNELISKLRAAASQATDASAGGSLFSALAAGANDGKDVS